MRRYNKVSYLVAHFAENPKYLGYGTHVELQDEVPAIELYTASLYWLGGAG